MTIPIVKGDSSLGRPFEATWKSGGDTIVLTVYKASIGETSATWKSRIKSEVHDALELYEPGV